MRLLTFLLCSTTLMFSVVTLCYGNPELDPIDDQYLKLKIDSTLSSDSIQRLHFVYYHLKEAHQALNTDQLDSAITHAELQSLM